MAFSICCCCCGAQNNALMQKNWIRWKRNPVGSCCEIFIPLMFIMILFSLRSSVSKEDREERHYISYDFEKNLKVLVPATFEDKIVGAQNPQLVDCNTRGEVDGQRGGGKEDEPFRTGHIALLNKNYISEAIKAEAEKFNYKTKYYDGLDDFNNYILSKEYNYDVCIGIGFEGTDVSQNVYKYQLMFNTTYQVDDVPDTLFSINKFYLTENSKEYLVPWILNGFLTIQNFIDNKIYKTEMGDENVGIISEITSMPTPKHVFDPLGQSLLGNFAPLIVLPSIIIFLRLLMSMLQEKEQKIREGMKIMGMTSINFYMSWIFWYLRLTFIIAVLVAILLRLSVFPKSDIFIVIFWYWYYCWTLIGQAVFIQVFFTSQKLGTLFGMVFFVIQYILSFIWNSDTTQFSTKQGLSMMSHCGMVYASDVFVLVESEGVGIDVTNIGKQVKNYTVGTCMGFCVLNALIFLLLGLYLDQVFPNEFGQSKHPLFFIRWLWVKHQPREEKDNNVEEDPNVEKVVQALQQLEEQNKCIKIRGLYKTYSNGKQAVNNLSLTMYENQIFALLGHNGAGKTTTISMLNGFLSITKGYTEVYGKDVADEMGEIRKWMGFCPQHDVLFPDLTVKEHLELFSVFKGVAHSEDVIQKMIQDVDLTEKTNVYSKSLSGGQKRRLSVAIAFIGDSKVIYLDEPTSGLDTASRRFVWDLLKKLKTNKLIVLTTHFMDEADYLGDRIAIMGEGELKCCGSSVYLKNKFGTGYMLTIQKVNVNVDSNPIISLVQSNIPNAIVQSNVSSEIGIQLSMEDVNKFEKLFDTLDAQKEKLQIVNYGISITTLEEVFLKVAEMQREKKKEEEKDNNNQAVEMQPIENKDNMQEKLMDDKNGDEADNFDLNAVRITNGVFTLHYLALVVKRLIYMKRDVRGMLCEVFLPSFIIIIGLAIQTIQESTESPYELIEPSQYPIPMPTTFSYDANKVSKSEYDNIVKQFNTDHFEVQHFDAKNDMKNWDKENLETIDKEHRIGSYFFKSANQNKYNYLASVQTVARTSAPLFMNQMNKAIIQKDLNKEIDLEVTVAPFKLTVTTQNQEAAGNAFGLMFLYVIAYAFIPAGFITFIVQERVDLFKHQQMVSGVSIPAYWLSNFTIDLFKFILPFLIGISMVQAYNFQVYTNDSEIYGCVVLLIFLIGLVNIPFTYMLSYLFGSPGGAQIATFFLNFLIGSLVPIVTFILQIIESTRDVGKALVWVLRIVPSFAFGEGMLNLAIKDLLASVIHGKDVIHQTVSPYDMVIAGGNVLMLCVFFVVYSLMQVLMEYLWNSGLIFRLFSKEDSVAYISKEYDDDVQAEIERVEKTDPKEHTIHVDKIRKVFTSPFQPTKVAVDQVSFGISNGECFTLLGVNGAGKTTTFKMLSGEIKPTSGNGFIHNYNIKTDMYQARQFIGYCPQFDALLPLLTAREHLELFAKIKGVPLQYREQLVIQKLKELDLKQFEHVQAGTYSGGNKRKLSVANALLGNPPIVFLDEPSTGMDPGARRFMWNVISRISTKRKQSSIILTTHSMEEAEALSTKLAVQVAGQLECIGTISHLKTKFGEGYEVEIKVEIPTNEEIKEMLFQSNIPTGSIIGMNNYLETLKVFKAEEDVIQSIQPHGYGAQVYTNLHSAQGMKVEELAEFVLLQVQSKQVLNYVSQNLGYFQMIEHLGNFTRIKLYTKTSIGKLFGNFEKNKQQLKIMNYSVKQTTIEQIFNSFAEGKIERNAHKKRQSMRPQQPQQDQQPQPQEYVKQPVNAKKYETNSPQDPGDEGVIQDIQSNTVQVNSNNNNYK